MPRISWCITPRQSMLSVGSQGFLDAVSQEQQVGAEGLPATISQARRLLADVLEQGTVPNPAAHLLAARAEQLGTHRHREERVQRHLQQAGPRCPASSKRLPSSSSTCTPSLSCRRKTVYLIWCADGAKRATGAGSVAVSCTG